MKPNPQTALAAAALTSGLLLGHTQSASISVPPAPGAPPNRMISFENLKFSRPYSASRPLQTLLKMTWASLTSKSSDWGGFLVDSPTARGGSEGFNDRLGGGRTIRS